MSLNAFLTRLILICILPLMILSAYFAFDRVRALQAERDLAASNLAQNFATSLDRHIDARISALEVLAASSAMDNPRRLNELYQEAQAFHKNFGSHVVLADLSNRMIFTTRVSFGTELPSMPQVKGHSSVATVSATGKPAVGDIFLGPINKSPLVSIAVPVIRKGRISHFMLSVMETSQFQKRLEELALPSGWSMTVLDGKNEVVARKSPQGMASRLTVADSPGRFVVKSSLSPWSVVLDVPRNMFRTPILAAATYLAVTVLLATMVSILGGLLASRRLARSVASLADPALPQNLRPVITEIETVRGMLANASKARSQAESTLRESERAFRSIFEQVAVGMALVALDGSWLQVNQRLCDIVGFNRDELLSLSFQDITYADDLNADLDYLRKLLSGDTVNYSKEKRYVRKDLSLVWVNLTAGLVRDAAGEPVYFISVVEDISERKRAEEELRLHKSILEETGQIAKVGGWTFNAITGEGFWTDEVARIYDLDPALPISRDIGFQYYSSESRPKIEAAVENAVEQGIAYDLELEIVSSKGIRKWVRTIGHPVTVSGRVISVHGSFQDITELKQAEARLESMVKDLQNSNRELEQFAYVASHDLQEPLRMVASYTQLLAERYENQLDDKARKFIHYAVDGAVRMQLLINDLLAYSRIGTKGNPLVLVDSHAMMGEAVNNLKMNLEETEAVVTGECLPEVRADASQLVQLFQNLISNGVKFRGEGLPFIRISAEDKGQEWLFSVKDNGIGIEPQYADKIFVIFQRLHTKEEFPGSGIGLAICKKIVERHGGRIWFESEPGKGTTFYFTIPK